GICNFDWYMYSEMEQALSTFSGKLKMGIGPYMAVKDAIQPFLKVHLLKKSCSALIFLIFFSKGFWQEAANFKKLEKTFRYNSKFIFDSSGFAWTAHDDGLYRYDGYDYLFTPYEKIFDGSITNPREMVFEKDSEGNFWLAASNGELT